MAFALSLLIVLDVALLGTLFASSSCLERWEASGRAARWSFTTGCMVRSPAGRWVPEYKLHEVVLT